MQLYEPKSQIGAFFDFCKHNPGFTLSISYVLLTLLGIFYSHEFYSKFSIPFLKLAETSDLLIVGIGEPAALLMFVGALLLAAVFDYAALWSYKRQPYWREKPKSVKRSVVLFMLYTPKHREGILMMILGIFVIYTWVFLTIYAGWQADRVMAGVGHKIMVSDSETDPEKPFMLLGSTANYVFLYSQQSEKASILPVENIQLLHPLASNADNLKQAKTEAKKSPD